MSSKRLFDFIGQPGVYIAGPVGMGMDGTAVFATANTLTLAGLPFVPEDVQWLGTIMVNAGGYSEFPAMEHLHTYAAPILTIGNVDPVFTGATDFLVLYAGQKKAYNPVGYDEVYLMSALNTVNDSVKNAPIIPPEIVCGGTLISNAVPGQTTQLVGASYELRHGVWMMIAPEQTISRPAAAADTIQMIGAYYTSAHNTIVDAAGLNVAGWAARRTALVEGAINSIIFAPVNDPTKIYTASSIASLVILWVGV